MNQEGIHRLLRKPSFPGKIHFMLTTNCSANCIFCPQDRGKHFKNKNMPFNIFSTVIDEMHEIGPMIPWQIYWSENGEGMLHPEFERYVTYAKEKAPKSIMHLTTNMSAMTESRARFVIANFAEIHFNIDGTTPETYQAAKPGLDYWKTMDNIERFIKLRDEINLRVHININILSARRYYEDMLHEETSLNDDSWRIIEALGAKPMIGISKQAILNWAVRYKDKKPRSKKYPCPGLSLLHVDGLISVDGDVYPCCQDYKAQQKFGNVLEEPLRNIWNGPRRHKILQMIYNREFDKLPTCKYCQNTVGEQMLWGE